MEVTIEVLKKSLVNQYEKEEKNTFDYFNKLTLLEKKDPVSSKKTLIDFLHWLIPQPKPKNVGDPLIFVLIILEKYLDQTDVDLLPTLYKLAESFNLFGAAKVCIAKIEGAKCYDFLVANLKSIIKSKSTDEQHTQVWSLLNLLTELSGQDFVDEYPRFTHAFIESEYKSRLNQILKKVIKWQRGGYKDGQGYIDKFSDFEIDIVDEETRIMSGINDYLRKFRAQRRLKDTCYLAKASGKSIKDITQRWNLPKRYLDFLIKYSPHGIDLESKSDRSYTLYGAEELIKNQEGLSLKNGKPAHDWDKKYLVVGESQCDPIAIILSDKEQDLVPLFMASHDLDFTFRFIAKDIYSFLERFIEPTEEVVSDEK